MAHDPSGEREVANRMGAHDRNDSLGAGPAEKTIHVELHGRPRRPQLAFLVEADDFEVRAPPGVSDLIGEDLELSEW